MSTLPWAGSERVFGYFLREAKSNPGGEAARKLCLNQISKKRDPRNKDGPVEHRPVALANGFTPAAHWPSWPSDLRCSRTALPFRWLRCGEDISDFHIATVVPTRTNEPCSAFMRFVKYRSVHRARRKNSAVADCMHGVDANPRRMAGAPSDHQGKLHGACTLVLHFARPRAKKCL